MYYYVCIYYVVIECIEYNFAKYNVYASTNYYHDHNMTRHHARLKNRISNINKL